MNNLSRFDSLAPQQVKIESEANMASSFSSTNPNQMLSSAIAAVTLKPTSPSLPNQSTYYDAASSSFAKTTALAKPNQSNAKYQSSFNDEQFHCLQLFETWTAVEQTEFVENLLRRMCHFQHGHINNFLRPMLQRDFISLLPGKLN